MEAPAGRMAEVELVEVDPRDPGGRGPAVVGRGRAAGTRWPGGRRRRTAAVMPVVLVLVVGVLAAALERRGLDHDISRVEAFSGNAGAVASLREPVGELWRAEGYLLGGTDEVLVLGGAEPADGVGGSGPTLPTLVGRDARTGDVRWSATLAQVPLACPAAAMDPVHGSTLVCETQGDGQVAPHSDAVLGEVPGSLVAVRARDGHLLARRDLDTRVVGWDVLDGDLVTARRTRDGVTVAREGIVDAVPVWDRTLELPAGVSARHLGVRVEGGAVVLDGAVGAVLGASGEVLGRWEHSERPAGVRVRVTPDGTGVWTVPGEGRWLGVPGGGAWRLPGEPVEEQGDDGPLLLRTSAGLAAVDVSTGQLLWSRSGERRAQVVVVGDVVVVAGRTQVRGLDRVAGTTRWQQARGPGGDVGRVLTDGVRVLVPAHGASSGRTAQVLDARDGTPVWSTPLPVGVIAVEAGPRGALVARTRGEVVLVGRA